MRLRTRLRVGVALTALGVSLAASAQAADAPVDRGTAIDEIVVTAQRREQRLQDVPVVVNTLSAQTVQDAGARDIKDISMLTPGLTVTSTQSSNSTSVRIRGVGTVGDNAGLESSVGIYIDGVYRPRAGVGFGDLGEIERVEILKGPQGTLFGKNTSAGVVSVITKAPTFERRFEAESTFTNYRGYGGSVGVNGPILGDVLAGRFYVAARKRDGFIDNESGTVNADRSRNDDDNDQDYLTARGQLLYRPSDDLKVRLIGDYSDMKYRCCGGLQAIASPTALAIINKIAPVPLQNPPDWKSFKEFSNRDNLRQYYDRGLSAEVTWKTPWFGGAEFTSITGTRAWQSRGGLDIDYTTLDISLSTLNSQDSKSYTQEFRLAGDTERVTWLVGAFAVREATASFAANRNGADFERYLSLTLTGGVNPLLASQLSGLPAGTVFPTNQGPADTFEQIEHSFAVFTNNDVHITSRVDLTVGLRYTWEEKNTDFAYRNTVGGRGCALIAANPISTAAQIASFCPASQNPNFNNLDTEQHYSDEAFTGTAKLAWRPTDRLLTYVSYAKGFKAGGFNLDRLARPFARGSALSLQPVVDTSFPAEKAQSYEVGFKSTLLDRSLVFNAAAFYQKFTDFQLTAYNGVVFTLTSIPEVTSRGVDVDFIYRPISPLTINGGVTFAETQYSDKDAAILGQPCGSTPTAGCSNLPGTRLHFAPRWSGSLGATYVQDLTETLSARFFVSAKYMSDHNAGSDLATNKNQKAYTLVNARVSVGPKDAGWSAELFANNLFDKRYSQTSFNGTQQTGSVYIFPGSPRLWGGTLRFAY